VFTYSWARLPGMFTPAARKIFCRAMSFDRLGNRRQTSRLEAIHLSGGTKAKIAVGNETKSRVIHLTTNGQSWKRCDAQFHHA
jgi:hypothetical protein